MCWRPIVFMNARSPLHHYTGEFVVITSGFLEGTSGATNMFQVRQVPE